MTKSRKTLFFMTESVIIWEIIRFKQGKVSLVFINYIDKEGLRLAPSSIELRTQKSLSKRFLIIIVVRNFRFTNFSKIYNLCDWQTLHMIYPIRQSVNMPTIKKWTHVVSNLRNYWHQKYFTSTGKLPTWTILGRDLLNIILNL